MNAPIKRIVFFTNYVVQMCIITLTPARMVASTGLGLGGSIAAAALLTGPLAIAVGIGACIAVALGDHFLGDKLASLFFTEDPAEVKKLIQGKHDKVPVL